MTTEETPTAGHNNPPEETLEETLARESEELRARHEALMAAISGLPDKVEETTRTLEDGTVETRTADQVAEALVLFTQQIKANAKGMEDMRTAKKKPYDALGKQVQAYFVPFGEQSKKAIGSVQGLLGVYATEKAAIERAKAAAARAEAEAAIKAAEEAADKEALKAAQKEVKKAIKAETSPTAGKTRSAAGGQTVSTTRIVFEIVDVNEIPRAYLQPDMAMIGEAIKATGLDTRIAGIIVREEVSTNVR